METLRLAQEAQTAIEKLIRHLDGEPTPTTEQEPSSDVKQIRDAILKLAGSAEGKKKVTTLFNKFGKKQLDEMNSDELAELAVDLTI